MATTPYPFVASTVLTASQLNSTFNIPVTTKTASHTLVAGDAGTRVVMNSASATTITVNTSVFSAGDNLEITNVGAGVTTVTAGTATVSSAGPLAIPQYGGGTLYFTSAGVAIFFPSAGPAATSGLTFVSATTITGASVNIANCFSATYRNYLIIGDSMTGGSNGYELEGRFGVSGTPTTANYTQADAAAANTASTLSRVNIVTFTANQGFIMNVYAPNVAASTMFTVTGVNNTVTGRLTLGFQTDATAFTDFNIAMQSGSTNFTAGTVRIYGYQNS